MPAELTANHFIARLTVLATEADRVALLRYFKTGPGDYGEGDVFIGVRMGSVFELAKEFIDMDPVEIEKVLESPIHEARAGALSLMGQQALRKKTPAARKRELFELYLRRTDRINNWDLVDVSCKQVIGAYLLDKPRDVLYELARSANPWERRIAMFSTFAFVSKGDVDDCFRLAEILSHDRDELVQKAVGGMVRQAGTKDRPRLIAFLDKYADTLPRVALRYAIEHLAPDQRRRYLELAKKA